MGLKDISLDINGPIETIGRLNHEDPSNWLKVVGSFANTHGGTLLLGADEKTSKLIGYTKEEAEKEKIYFSVCLKEHMHFPPENSFKLLPYTKGNQKLYLIQISVNESKYKPLFLEYGGFNSVFLRKENKTYAATGEEIRQLLLTYPRPSFDKILTDQKYNSEDFQEYFNFCKEHGEGKAPTDKELASLPFFNEDGYLYQGSYLFSDRCKNTNTKIVCTVYSENTKGTDTFLSSQGFEGSLIQDYRFIMDFIGPRNLEKFTKKDTSHTVTKSYPTRSIFEGVINALAHRDYFMKGTQIDIDLFPNRLTISSPGELFMVGEMKPTRDLTSFISRRRNELICSIFILAGAMEAKGTGLEKIAEDYKDADERHKPYLFSKDGQFSLVLPDLNNPEGVDFLEDELVLLAKINNPSRFDRSILSFCYGKSRSVAEIAEHCSVSVSSFLRNILKNLVAQNFLLENKVGNTTYYESNSNFVHLN